MAAKTKTKEKPKDKVAEPARSAGAVAKQPDAQPEGPRGLRLRVPYPTVWGPAHGVDIDRWKILIDTAWPAAKTPEAVCLAIEYCRWRKLDPMKKMVHIVPVYAKDGGGHDANGKPIGGMIETVWPGIAEIRITATRTGEYAGKDAMVFGPDVTETFTHTEPARNGQPAKTTTKTVTYPEWAELTVYRMVQGQRCAFTGPKVKWKEAYATESRWSPVPNEMWADRTQGQLDKCAEAAALRSAFPEELGGEHSAEEMYGRVVEHAPVRQAPQVEAKPLLDGEVRPGATGASEFQRTESPKAQEPKAQPDGRPEPPPLGEPVNAVVETTASEVAAEPKVDLAMEAELNRLLLEGTEKLKAVDKVGALAELRELYEQELPPESQQLKEWLRRVEARQEEIVKAGKVKP